MKETSHSETHSGAPACSASVIVSSPGAAPAVGAYPHARRVGSLLFLSGIGPRRPGAPDIPGVTRDSSGQVSGYDIRTQTHACFDNIVAILQSAGLDLSHVVDVQVFLVDIKKDFAAFNETYATYFTTASGPTRTTIGVTGLPTPIHVELKVIAAYPNP